MKLHHKKTHGVSIAGQPAVCEYCGEDFRYEPSTGETGRFCSNECKFSHWNENGRDEEVVEKIAETRRGESLPDEHYERLSRQMEGRDITWGDKISEAKTGSSRPDMRGENNPFWKGGDSPDYGYSWNYDLKEKVRERDNRECQDCGIKESELEVALDVHHITPVREFENKEKANQPKNLICLCRSCHNRIEKGNFNCPKPTNGVSNA